MAGPTHTRIKDAAAHDGGVVAVVVNLLGVERGGRRRRGCGDVYRRRDGHVHAIAEVDVSLAIRGYGLRRLRIRGVTVASTGAGGVVGVVVPVATGATSSFSSLSPADVVAAAAEVDGSVLVVMLEALVLAVAEVDFAWARIGLAVEGTCEPMAESGHSVGGKAAKGSPNNNN